MTGPDTTLDSLSALDTRPEGLCLRFPDGQTKHVAMPPGKATLGAGAGCTVPIRYPGVGPLHCVIYPVDSGWRVRRWSSETQLNGELFTDAPIEVGDRLQIGPVEVEFVTRDAIPSDLEVADPPAFYRDQSDPSQRHLRADVSDYLPVAMSPESLAKWDAVDERFSGHGEQIAELERQLAEFAAEHRQWRNESDELRRQMEEARHELAHAEHLHSATREAVIELGRQLAELRATAAASQPLRPRDFGAGRRVFPAELRRLTAHETACRGPHSKATVNQPKDNHVLADEPPESTGDLIHFPHEVQSQPNEERQGWTIAEATESASTDEQNSVETPDSAPESFFSRFQHLLKREEGDNDVTPDLPQSSQVVATEPPTASNHAQVYGSDDDSIEGYMSRLLQRVRGEMSCPLPAAATQPSVSQPADSNVSSGRHDSFLERTEQPAIQPLSNLEEIKAAPAPERSRNMAALRDLANQCAHGAIQTSTMRHQRESSIIKLAISLLGIICGLVVMKLSPSYTSPEFISGLVPMCAGLVWAGLTILFLFRAIRDGSFGDEGEGELVHELVSPDISADEL